jgi:biopolymer transport protein ExbB
MLPIILCSVLSLAIVIERSWSLRKSNVMPSHLLPNLKARIQNNELNEQNIVKIRASSPLGSILGACLLNGVVNLAESNPDRELLKERIEDTGRQIAIELEQFINMLGTIAVISPLLGLLGTVIGMIAVFSVITTIGVGDPSELADGIAQALLTTAAGLLVAIPSVIFHRYFRRRIEVLVVAMEEQAVEFIDFLYD